jgi:hypothetical protein
MGAPLNKQRVIDKINTGNDKNKKRMLKILGKDNDVKTERS